MADIAEISRAYDRWSESYDGDANATRDLDAAVLRRAPLALGGCAVLELGCGTGKNTVWLAEHADSVVSLDCSARMLAVARERVVSPSVQFIQHDVRTTWPVADASIDLVVADLVLEHVENLAPVFAEIARVLRAGGQFFLSELHPYRQIRGGQAHFNDSLSGETVYVTAFVHSVSDFVNGGLAAELILEQLGEWHDDGAKDGAPRLLSVLFRKR